MKTRTITKNENKITLLKNYKPARKYSGSVLQINCYLCTKLLDNENVSRLRINLNKTIAMHKSVHINTQLTLFDSSCVALYTVYFLRLTQS